MQNICSNYRQSGCLVKGEFGLNLRRTVIGVDLGARQPLPPGFRGTATYWLGLCYHIRPRTLLSGPAYCLKLDYDKHLMVELGPRFQRVRQDRSAGDV